MLTKPTFKNFLLEEEGPVAIFTSNRPEVMNAMNLDSNIDLLNFAEYLEHAEHLRVAIITGAGDKAFSAGADLNAVRAQSGVKSLQSKLRISLAALENCSKPIIAAINGFAFGGGFELALACDIRLVSENAMLGLPETGLGVIPGAGGTQRLSRMVGIGVAKDIILGGRTLNPQEAVQFGVAMKAVPLENLMDEAKKLAGKMVLKGPIALNVGKKVLNASMYTDTATGCTMEALALAILFDSKDKLEGTSAFLEKRKPQFKGE
jgi:enoyl-CoA hydratase